MRRFYKLTRSILLAALVNSATLPYALAAQAPPSEETVTPVESGESEVTVPDQPQTSSEERRANDKGGVFRPSEDISEDLIVTFPVDI